MDPVSAVLGLLGVSSAAVWVQHRWGPGWSWAVLVISAVGLAAPFSLGPAAPAAVRSGLSFASTFYFLRCVDLVVRRAAFSRRSLVAKLAHVFLSFHDIHLARPHPAGRGHVDLDVLAAAAGDAGVLLAAAGLLWARDALSVDPGPRYLAGLAAGGLVALGSLNLFGHTLQLLAVLLAGMQLPELMRQPERAASLADFWGRRWNTVVQRVLANVHRVVRRRAPAWFAVVATFLASGIWHTYPVAVAGMPPHAAASMLAYFLLQALLVLVERAVAVTKDHAAGAGRSSVLGRAWTFLAVAGPAPLILSPAFSLCGGQL